MGCCASAHPAHVVITEPLKAAAESPPVGALDQQAAEQKEAAAESSPVGTSGHDQQALVAEPVPVDETKSEEVQPIGESPRAVDQPEQIAESAEPAEPDAPAAEPPAVAAEPSEPSEPKTPRDASGKPLRVVTQGSLLSSDGEDRTMWEAKKSREWEHTDERPHVFIIGAGFGGLKAARDLKDQFRVTVCDCKDYFQYGPGVMRSFVDPDHFDKVVFPLQPIIEGEMGCAFLWGEVDSIDPAKREVHLRRLTEFCGDAARGSMSGIWPARKESQETVVKFDYCIVAAGCSYNKIAKNNGNSLWFPTVLDSNYRDSPWAHIDERTIQGRKMHILEEYEKLKKLNAEQGEVLVAGAGFIGVEWAMEMRSAFHDLEITLVNRPKQILSRWPDRAVEYAQECLNSQKKVRTYTGVTYDHGDPEFLKKVGFTQEPGITYACTGVQASVSFLDQDCLTDVSETGGRYGPGWVRVNKKLQVCVWSSKDDGKLEPWCQDEEGHARVFAIGDCAHVHGLQPMPKQCYPSEEQGFIVSRIIQMTEGQVSGCPERQLACGPPRPLPDSHWPWGAGMVVLSLGPRDGCFVLGGTHEAGTGIVALKGILAAVQKEIIEVTKVSEEQHGIVGRMVWHYVHNTPVHLWGEGPMCGY